MRRLELLGTVAFVTVLISLVFHLIGMSFTHWIRNTCLTCPSSNPLGSWVSSINQRCYESSMAAVFTDINETKAALMKTFITEICIPNQYLMAKDKKYAPYCLLKAINQSDIICALETYNKDYCKCDYTTRTKSTLAMTIISSLCLGIMVFLSHTISFSNADHLLRWLIPLSSSILTLGMICMIVTLGLMGGLIKEDVMELRYQWSLVQSTLTNLSIIDQYKQGVTKQADANYSVKIGWCFGMEILALHFSFVSLIVYGLMLNTKQRPEPRR